MTIGLDIGSSAIRAAEVAASGEGRKVLRRYAQVGIPAGYVVDGEINNIPAVAAALKRLWSEGGFSGTEVVLGVSGPRVFVRQADVPNLSAEELRSSLRFDAQEMIPIAMDDASFDFSVLDSPEVNGASKNPDAKKRILLVAAHRDVLHTNLAVLKEAGLTAKVLDAAPLALMRAVPDTQPDSGSLGVEVIVSIGADLTTVGVRQGGVPMFIRSLTVGGTKLTESIANGLHVELAVAERLKRGGATPAVPQIGQARRAMSADLRDLAEDVRATIDFFVSQAEGAQIERLLITGGAAQTEGLGALIAGGVQAPVHVFDPLAPLDTKGLGYEDAERARISVGAATAIGLALWPSTAPLIRLSVLPDEILKAQKTRRLMAVAAGALCAVAGVLAVAGAGEILAVHAAQGKLHSAQARVTTLQGQVSRLSAATAVHSQAQAKAQAVRTDLQGDLDWVRVMGQLAAVMPPDLSLTTFTGTRTSTPSGSGSSGAATSGSAPGVGTVTFNVKGTGGLPAAASWLVALSSDPDLQNVSLGGITVTANGGTVTFTSNAQLTPVSDSNRDKGI